LETKFVPLMVSVCAPEPALTDGGERLVMAGTGSVPIPERFTDCGLPGASSDTVTEAVRFPSPEGENTALALQFAPGAIEAPHVLLTMNSDALAPPTMTLVMVKAVLPELTKVTVCGLLAVPTT
jgi:hypothetical protein